jgi:AcrR family transcriptional regulator
MEKSRRDAYTEATVMALVRAGRERFGLDGYDAVGLGDIAADAQVTTGAIYHHFEGKKGLFLAVAEEIERELLAQAQSVSNPDPWHGLIEAFLVLLDSCASPEVQRIIFLDAPRVIGPEKWREIELKYAFGAMSGALAALAQGGVIQPYSADLLAPVLLSLLAESSRAVAANPALRESARELVRRVLDGLRLGPV